MFKKWNNNRKIKTLLLSNDFNYDMVIMSYFYGEIAQLARARGSYPRSRGFESPSRYQIDRKLELFRV